MSPATPALHIRDLDVSYPSSGGPRRQRVQVLEGVDLDVAPGSVLGLVGESGSGKSTLARAVTGLVRRDAGTIEISGQPVPMSGRYPQDLRRRVQMVFQDPYSSLNPAWPIGRTIAEPLALRGGTNKAERRRAASEALQRVGIDPSVGERKPHAFSGGQRQRIAIARAIAVEPDLLICDEPVSALDVSTQNQILALLRELQRESGVAVVFISHDLAVVRQIATDVAVMYLGKIVERGPVAAVLHRPLHPYSAILRDAVPRVGGGRIRSELRDVGVTVGIGDPGRRQGGCVFADRCPLAIDICRKEMPPLERRDDEHLVACHRADDVAAMTVEPEAPEGDTHAGVR